VPRLRVWWRVRRFYMDQVVQIVWRSLSTLWCVARFYSGGVIAFMSLNCIENFTLQVVLQGEIGLERHSIEGSFLNPQKDGPSKTVWSHEKFSFNISWPVGSYADWINTSGMPSVLPVCWAGGTRIVFNADSSVLV
jgi:hypothetical protein